MTAEYRIKGKIIIWRTFADFWNTPRSAQKLCVSSFETQISPEAWRVRWACPGHTAATRGHKQGSGLRDPAPDSCSRLQPRTTPWATGWGIRFELQPVFLAWGLSGRFFKNPLYFPLFLGRGAAGYALLLSHLFPATILSGWQDKYHYFPYLTEWTEAQNRLATWLR